MTTYLFLSAIIFFFLGIVVGTSRVGAGGVNFPTGLGVYKQPTAGSINPAWTFTSVTNIVTNLAAFYP